MGIVSRVKEQINWVYNKVSISINRNVSLGKDVVINGRLNLRLTDAGKVVIGDRARINSGKDYNLIGGDTRTNLVTVGHGRILIGCGTGISNSTLVAQTEIDIGENVKIGGSVKIYDTDFHSLKYSNRVLKSDPDIKTARIVIKNGAFIGAHSIILKGVTIGEHSVIGAGSVVTRDIPDGEIWAGNPAAMIRKIFD